jgi:hypothetical protein
MTPLGREIYQLALRFPTYSSFADASIEKMFTPAQRKESLHYETDTFASMCLHNDGKGRFSERPLPNLAQIAPVRTIVVDDIDGDGRLDLVVGGNLYDAEPNTPRADAGNGLWLRGDGKGHFTAVPTRESGLIAPLNVAGMALIRTPYGKALLVANTNDSLQTFVIKRHQ